MAKGHKVNLYLNKFWLILKLFMAFRMFQAFDLKKLVFVQTISYGLKSKVVSYYKWVIWYKTYMILYDN